MRKLYLCFLLILLTPFTYCQDWITIGTNGGAGTYASTNNTYGPFSTNTSISWNRHAYIYPASLLTQLPGNSTIDSLFFPRLTQSGLYGSLSGMVNCKIYLKNTTATDFGATALDWSAESGSASLMYDDDPTAIIGSSGGFKKFILSTPFLYTGDNLEMLVEYTQLAPASGEVIWGYDNELDIPEYLVNSTKYVSGTSGSPTNSLTNTNPRHPALAIFYTSLNPIDAGIVSLSDPLTISCYNTPQQFTVELKNAGITSIAAGAALVTLKISGANTFLSSVNNAGAIAPGSSEFINFTGVDLSNAGLNYDTAFVTLPGDPITTNNKTSLQTWTAETISTFPAVEDVEGSLPVFGYSSVVKLYDSWLLYSGKYGNFYQTDSLLPHSGSNFFLFDSYNDPDGTTSRLYSNCLTLTNGTSGLEFYMSHDEVLSEPDSLYVSVSTDKGINWTRIAGFQRYDPAFTTPEWRMETVDLSAYAGLTIQIGFEGVSHFGNAFGLDDITIASASITPVTLLNFNAKRSGSSNTISWSTSQELNSRYFAVEHSNDGVHFGEIGRISATGNSTTQRSYEFIDQNPVKGFNYYRLRIVDIDNAAKYSLIKSLKFIGLKNFIVYPNPVKNKLQIDIESDKTDKATLSITDISGRNIYNSNVTLSQGANTISLDIDHFAKGTYLLKIQITGESFMRKFSKQ